MSEERNPFGRTCEIQALLIVLLAPIALPVLVARTMWLRRKGRVA